MKQTSKSFKRPRTALVNKAVPCA